jgi:hypothetical protein
MRHFLGFVLAIVMGAVVFLAAGWGVATLTSLTVQGLTVNSTHGLTAIGAVAGSGLLLGILLAVPAVSPLATGLPGLALLGWTALLVVNAGHAVRLIPMQGHTFATGFGDMLTTGVLAVAGAAMIVPLFVPSRWRRRYVYDDYADEPAGIGLMR